MNNKVRLTVARNKILNIKEVPPDEVKFTYESFSSLQDFINYCSFNSLRLGPNVKIALSHNADREVGEASLVELDHEDPLEYIFNNEEEAKEFAKRQGYDPSIHLLPKNVQDNVSNFFNGVKGAFEGSDELLKSFEKEIEIAGGDSCPDCSKNAIMRKYQDIILDMGHKLAEKKLAEPQKTISQRRNKAKKESNKKTKK
jgi:hypothetical protein